MSDVELASGLLLANPEADERDLFNAAEAAKLIGMHPNTIRRWIYAGHLNARKSPGPYGRFLITKSDLIQTLKQFKPAKDEKAGR